MITIYSQIENRDIRVTAEQADRAVARSDWELASELSFQVSISPAEMPEFVRARYTNLAQYCATMVQNVRLREANAISTEIDTSLKMLLARQSDTDETLETISARLTRAFN